MKGMTVLARMGIAQVLYSLLPAAQQLGANNLLSGKCVRPDPAVAFLPDSVRQVP
jgi:hypothetical protein